MNAERCAWVEAIMSRALTKEDMALLEEADEMFNETACVPVDGEQVPAERCRPATEGES